MKLSGVRLLACDVDGVLTDGTLYYGAGGEALKAFDVRDGMGVRQLLEGGVEVALVTSRNDGAVLRRAEELGIRHVRVGRRDKWTALEEIMTAIGVLPHEVAFVGDDVQDLEVLGRVGLPIAVADAHARVKAAARWVTAARGGRGAIREIADRILAPGEFRVVIPSRFGSTRLPGKPLRPIAGRPMIAHVLDRARESGAAEVLVATDDERIRSAVEGLGGRALMTSPRHPSGTDRLAEVAATLGWPDDAVVVNLQGDEPLMPGPAIRTAAEALREQPQAGIATLATPITEEREIVDRNVVKVVVNDAGMACWFSRSPISRVRHLGLYAYRVGVLRRLAAEPPRPHEQAESLEQLRALEMGIGIHVSILDKAPLHGVDTEADLQRVEAWLSSPKER